MIQGSEEWFAARVGHCTASRFSDVLAKIKTGEAASRRNYRVQLVTERLTGVPVEGYQNAAMAWGNEQESAARMAYEALTGEVVEEAGFIQHPKIGWCGGSPDGLVGDSGGVEIKCPFVSTVHVETVLAGEVPSEHVVQIQGCMAVTGRRWFDFVSFDPRMPANLQLFVVRVARDEEYIARLESEVRQFLSEVEAMTELLRRRA